MTSTISTPLVSVIVRTKDRLNNLKQCLQSIVEQTYRPIEIVVINDGGCDVSPITNTIPADITPLILQLKKNVGRTQAANQGLEAASGDYLCFLDDDDLWYPNHLQILVPYLTEHFLNTQNLNHHPRTKPLGLVYGSTQALEVDSNGETHDISTFETPFNALDLMSENFIPIMSALFLRQWIDEGVRFDTQFDLYEDWDFWLQINQKCDFKHIPQITSLYHLHENASGVHNQTQAQQAALQIHKKWLPSLTTQNIAQLIQQTHKNHEDKVSLLQSNNQKQLNTIGEQHSHALKVIQDKDQNIKALEIAYDEAIRTIEQKDEDIAHLTRLYENAIDTIEQKDEDIAHLTRLYENAIDTITTKDDNIEHLNSSYRQTINTKDLAIDRLKEANITVQKENQKKSELIDNLQDQLDKSKKELSRFEASLVWRLHKKITRLKN